MKQLSGFLQFAIGILMAVAFLLGGGIAAALYLAAKHSTQPDRPVFDEEQVASQPVSKSKTSPNQQKPATAPSAAPAAQPANTPKPLEPGAYRARVIWAEGLLLRDRPSFSATSLGGVPFNGRVVVLEESSDKEWQQVRLENSDQKGWIKGGNTERLNEE